MSPTHDSSIGSLLAVSTNYESFLVVRLSAPLFSIDELKEQFIYGELKDVVVDLIGAVILYD